MDEGLCFQPIFYIILQLLESELFSFKLHLHRKLVFLHAIILFVNLINLLLQFGYNSIFFFDQPRLSSFLSLGLRGSLSVSLRFSQLLLEMFHSLLILLESYQLILQKYVFLSKFIHLRLIFPHRLEQFLTKVVIHSFKLVNLLLHLLIAAINSMPPLLFVLLFQLFQFLPQLYDLSLLLVVLVITEFQFFLQQLILVGQFLQMFHDFRLRKPLIRISKSLIDRVLYDYYKSMLTALVKSHDSLNVVFFVRGLHKDSDDQLEESLDMLGGIMFCDFDQIYIFSPHGFATLPHVKFHLLHYLLQISQTLNPSRCFHLQFS